MIEARYEMKLFHVFASVLNLSTGKNPGSQMSLRENNYLNFSIFSCFILRLRNCWVYEKLSMNVNV